VPEQRPPVFSYSPDRRTALVLCGTGTHGAYHAGVLQAFQEAGVKIDLIAGHGIGAAGAAVAAIDGGSRLWDANGIWRSTAPTAFYRWRPLLRVAGWLAIVLAFILLIPVIVLAVGLIVFLIGFLLTLLGLAVGQSLTAACSATLDTLFAAEHLPTVVPRLGVAVLALLIAVTAGGVLLTHWRMPLERRAEGGWWWRLLAGPLDGERTRQAFADAIWQLIRGAAALPRPAGPALGRRFAEVLAENIGQPGFREVIVAATDLDARRDIVAALLREPYAQDFAAPRPGRDRRLEIFDLADSGREYGFDIVNGALTPPFACDPALIRFSPDSAWRGETHRLCDRPGLVGRLLEEVAAAGVTQVVIVTGVPPVSGPHRLAPPRLDLRSRIGDFMAAAEAAAMRDALALARLRFDGVYVIAPAHNPIGPFDFDGAYDPASDRRESLVELLQGAYDDAYRQFIEPVVGASGDQLAQASDLEP
jgi:hypothetical protein